MENKMIQMASGLKADVILTKWSWGEWACTYEGTSDDAKVKVSGEGTNPTEAVAACYAKWLRITGAVPELLGALQPPAYGDFTEE